MTSDRFRKRPANPWKRGVEQGGSVKQLPSGRYRAAWPRKIDILERNINPDGQTYTTEAEAREALRLILINFAANPELFEFDNDEPDAPPAIRTVAIATQEFIDGSRTRLASKTLREYTSIRRVVVCNPKHGIGGQDVKALTAGTLTTWRDKTLVAAGVTPAQAAYGWRFLRSVLSWEVESDRIVANPAMGHTKRRTKKQTSTQVLTSRVTVPTWQQEADLVLAVKDESRRLLMLLLLRAGPRFGEAASIDPDNLNETQNTIWLEHQWVRSDAGWIKEPLKTGFARDLHVPPQLMAAIVDYRRNRWTKPPPGRKRVLFPHIGLSGSRRTRGGSGVWTAAEWRRLVMIDARTKAGVPKLRTKDLRMSAASNFADAGFSTAQVQEMLGHAPGSGVTSRHYVRPITETKKHNKKREAIRSNNNLAPDVRLKKLWDAWTVACGDPLQEFENS